MSGGKAMREATKRMNSGATTQKKTFSDEMDHESTYFLPTEVDTDGMSADIGVKWSTSGVTVSKTSLKHTIR